MGAFGVVVALAAAAGLGLLLSLAARRLTRRFDPERDSREAVGEPDGSRGAHECT